ncbi:MAG: response regulator [Rhodospirillaceae bacterium]
MRLLLVEDHERFAQFVRVSIEKEGFTVDTVYNAEDAEAAFSTVNYDAILLDLGLPDADGLDLRKSWRVDDRVLGLNPGGDDYLVKPFAMEELVARVRALLCLPGGALGTVMTAGNITFDATAREVQVDGGEDRHQRLLHPSVGPQEGRPRRSGRSEAEEVRLRLEFRRHRGAREKGGGRAGQTRRGHLEGPEEPVRELSPARRPSA